MVLGALGVIAAVLAAVAVLMGVALGAAIGRRYTNRMARLGALAVTVLGLTVGFSLVVFEVLTVAGIALMLLGICALVTVSVQLSRPMTDPLPSPKRARRRARQERAPIIVHEVVDAKDGADLVLESAPKPKRRRARLPRSRRRQQVVHSEAAEIERMFWSDNVWPNEVIETRRLRSPHD
ncbi:MAG: hypothetical protein ACOYNI_12395 [Acidimicrobiia bacterium]